MPKNYTVTLPSCRSFFLRRLGQVTRFAGRAAVVGDQLALARRDTALKALALKGRR